MKRTLLCIVICFFVFYGCSKNGIEGNVKYYGMKKAVSGIKIEAKTNTDIKEEQSKASFTAITDSNGHFSIKGLLPNQTYQITAIDPRFSSTAIYENAPEKGTKLIKEPLIVYPIPEGPGIWHFDESEKFKRILEVKEDSKKKIRIHKNAVIGFDKNLAFSAADEDIKSATATFPRAGLLIIAGDNISSIRDIGQLFQQPAQTLAGTNIPAGWYYNIDSFWEDYDNNPNRLYGEKELTVIPNVTKVDLSKWDIYKSKSMQVIPLYNFSPPYNKAPSYYIFITSLSKQIFPPQICPEEGFVIKIEGGK